MKNSNALFLRFYVYLLTGVFSFVYGIVLIGIWWGCFILAFFLSPLILSIIFGGFALLGWGALIGYCFQLCDKHKISDEFSQFICVVVSGLVIALTYFLLIYQ